ncbi:MAG: hypothetical protein D6681_16645 [Calditrichaeota bacterium]|nr:MAG: hypothetical protein D6681_16645 [Calditrichota bacterium]
MAFACSNDKFPLPDIPPAERQFTGLDSITYEPINPPWDVAHGYNFRRPADVYVGVDNFIYVCDTGNDRIVMLDIGGQVQGISQFIPHPEAITQNDSLQLLIVNKTNVVYRIDLVPYNHQIGAAPIDTVFHFASEPSLQFTGITVHNKFEYYVTAVDTADSSQNVRAFSFIFDFTRDHRLKGPLPMHVNGTGLFSAIVPTGIVSLREQWLDISPSRAATPAFIFCQKGRTRLLTNNFRVQHITTIIVEGDEMLAPNTGLIGSDLYDPGKFYFPEDVAIDRDGFVFVVDAGHPSGDPAQPKPGFYRFSLTSGNQLQAVLGFGRGEKQFRNPKGIAVLPFVEDQIVYVADTGNDRIVLFKLSNDL